MTVGLPDTHDFDLEGQALWERQFREPTRAHHAFRLYRDCPPARRDIATVAEQIGLSVRRAREWAVQWEWRERATAWDDACHRIEDQERLEAIRSMHRSHRRAGRAAIEKAVQALGMMEPGEMPAGAIARLLELGAKLERSTLIVSVEELQGVELEDDEVDDPWERIAHELDPGEPADTAGP
jgi:hypothetical protein